MGTLISLTNLPQILVTWSVFFGAGLLFLAAGFWANRRNFSAKQFLAGSFPFNFLSSKSVRLDVKVYAIVKLTDVFWSAPGVLLAAVLPLGVVGVLDRLAPTSPQVAGPVVLAGIGIVLFLTTDLADFLIHYCEHKIPALWELHKVHHAADSLNPLTARRGHPLCIVLENVVRAFFLAIPAGAAMHFAGLSLVEILAIRALTGKTSTLLSLDPLRHSPFPVGFGWLDRLLISPHMHQVHHSSLQPHWDKNFGSVLSVYDWVFRTGYKPAKDEPIRLGLYGYSPAESAVHHTLYGTFVTPVAKSWGKLVGVRSRTPEFTGELISATSD